MILGNISNIRVDQHHLDNSLYVVSHQDSSNPIICLQLYIKTGSVHEEPDKYGYAHFLEHLVFKSTSGYPNNDISIAATSMGMVLNAYTDFDTTCYYLMLPAERLSEALYILSQMTVHADIRAQDVSFEKDIIVEEINQYESDPEMSFIEYIQGSYFPQSPLSHPVLGSQSSVSQATAPDLRLFYRNHYHPGSAFLVAVGDFEQEKLLKLANQYFASWKPRKVSSTSFRHVYPEQISFTRRSKPGAELLAIALPELNERHPDSEALHIAIRYLAIGKSSLLHKELVEEKKLCSFVKVSSVSGLISGISVILMAPTQSRFKARILQIFFRHYHRLMQNGVPQSAMQLVKKDIIHGWLYSFDTVEHKANLIAAEVFNQDLSRLQSYGTQVEAIQNPDIMKALSEHWQQSRLAVYYQGQQDFQIELEDYIDARWKEPSQADDAAIYADIDLQDPPKRPLNLAKSNRQEYYNFQLPGGMKVVYNYIPNRPVCGFALSTPLCQLNEELPGQNYFTGALMLYGTHKHSHSELMQISRSRGFNIRVQHHLDSTIFRGKCYFGDLFDALSILQEVLSMPHFQESYLKMLKSAALDSLRRESSYPPSYAYNRWFSQVFGKDNRLLRATGERNDILNLSLDDCIFWYNQWHLGRDFSLCIAASVEPDQIRDICAELFSCKESANPPLPHQLMYSPGTASQCKQYKHKEQSVIHLGGFACPASERENNSAFHVLAQALGGDLSSRLYAILREKHGYAYQTGFDFSSIADLGFWYAYAFCDPADYRNCLITMQDIINSVAQDGLSAQELEIARNYLISVNRFDAESVSFKAATIANLISLGYDLDFYLNREQRISATSLEQIHALASKWLKPENQFIHVMV